MQESYFMNWGFVSVSNLHLLIFAFAEQGGDLPFLSTMVFPAVWDPRLRHRKYARDQIEARPRIEVSPLDKRDSYCLLIVVAPQSKARHRVMSVVLVLRSVSELCETKKWVIGYHYNSALKLQGQ